MSIGSIPREQRGLTGLNHSPHLALRLKKEQSYTLPFLHGLLEGEIYLCFFTSSDYISNAIFDKIRLLNHHSFTVHNLYGIP
jgi:hypothetical protein